LDRSISADQICKFMKEIAFELCINRQTVRMGPPCHFSTLGELVIAVYFNSLLNDNVICMLMAPLPLRAQEYGLGTSVSCNIYRVLYNNQQDLRKM